MKRQDRVERKGDGGGRQTRGRRKGQGFKLFCGGEVNKRAKAHMDGRRKGGVWCEKKAEQGRSHYFLMGFLEGGACGEV